MIIDTDTLARMIADGNPITTRTLIGLAYLKANAQTSYPRLVREMAASLGWSKAAVTRFGQLMEKQRFVSRDRQKDQRLVKLTLTRAGASYLDRIEQGWPKKRVAKASVKAS